MKDLSIEHHAAEWASDAIPTRRDEDGLGCFYRRDLQAAFKAGYAFKLKTAAQSIQSMAELYGDITNPGAAQAEKEAAHTLEELEALARKRGYHEPAKWAKTIWNSRKVKRREGTMIPLANVRDIVGMDPNTPVRIMGVDLASNQDFSAVTLQAGQQIVRIEDISDTILKQMLDSDQLPLSVYADEMFRRASAGVPGEGEV